MKRSTVGIWALFFILDFLAVGFCAAAVPSKAGPLSAQDAVALAEKFVMEQGYTDLQPKAVGVRPESDMWFVGFRAVGGDQIRGIMISDNGQKLKRVSQSLKLDWLMSKPEQTTPEQATEPGLAEAQGLAEKFVGASKVKGLAKRAAKMTEHKADPAGDSADSWWAWFEKASKKGAGKAASFAIVSVDKKTRQAKWVKQP